MDKRHPLRKQYVLKKPNKNTHFRMTRSPSAVFSLPVVANKKFSLQRTKKANNLNKPNIGQKKSKLTKKKRALIWRALVELKKFDPIRYSREDTALLGAAAKATQKPFALKIQRLAAARKKIGCKIGLIKFQKKAENLLKALRRAKKIKRKWYPPAIWKEMKKKEREIRRQIWQRKRNKKMTAIKRFRRWNRLTPREEAYWYDWHDRNNKRVFNSPASVEERRVWNWILCCVKKKVRCRRKRRLKKIILKLYAHRTARRRFKRLLRTLKIKIKTKKKLSRIQLTRKTRGLLLKHRKNTKKVVYRVFRRAFVVSMLARLMHKRRRKKTAKKRSNLCGIKIVGLARRAVLNNSRTAKKRALWYKISLKYRKRSWLKIVGKKQQIRIKTGANSKKRKKHKRRARFLNFKKWLNRRFSFKSRRSRARKGVKFRVLVRTPKIVLSLVV